MKFVLDELARLNTAMDSPFAGRLELSRTGLMGHSLGGEAAIFSLEHEARFRAGVIIEGVISNGSVMGTDKAVLILAAGREQWSANECQLWSHLRGFRFAVNLLGADHMTPSDGVWVTTIVPELAIQTGAMGPQKTIAAIRNYVATFFGTNLRGQRLEPLLMGPSSDYPDAVVTSQNQLLCGER